ncbi:MAG: NnrT protein [Sphingomonadaceae bacterium]|nr:NnrT protein [Sphingomonadaceae bacterium]
MGWTEFAAALGVFLLSHAVPVRAPVKPWLVGLVGQRGFTIAYSLLSLAVLAWLITAAGRAPFVMLWAWEPWHNHLVLAVMAVVCLILALAIGRPNPFSFGGTNNAACDPARPGIVGWMRHPLLAALALWAGAHAFANGTLAHVLMFGIFAAFALLGGRLIDRRRKREMGLEWHRLHRLIVRPGTGTVMFGQPLRLVAGGGLYVVLILIHPLLFGVSPIL